MVFLACLCLLLIEVDLVPSARSTLFDFLDQACALFQRKSLGRDGFVNSVQGLFTLYLLHNPIGHTLHINNLKHWLLFLHTPLRPPLFHYFLLLGSRFNKRFGI